MRLAHRLLALAASAALIALAADAKPARSVALSERVSLIFASKRESAALLAQADDFTRSCSAFDRAARTGRVPAPTHEEVRAYFAAQAREWSPAARARLSASIARLRAKIAPFEHWLPERVLLVSSTEALEGGTAHTRGASVIFPEPSLERSAADLDALLAHELFHVLSRHQPVLRDRLYALIGFAPCPKLEIPSDLRDAVITNPDAPRIEHAIRVEHAHRSLWVAPLLLAEPRRYDPKAGGDLFEYLTLRFLPVKREGGACTPDAHAEKRLIGIEELSQFSEQIGRNTDYIIHPEEILADNFALLVNGASSVPTPDLIERMRGAMMEPLP